MKLYQNFSLKDYNTFGVRASARAFLFIENERELTSAVYETLLYDEFFVLGGGSNVLFAGDYDGVILKYTPDRIKIIEENAENAIIEAEAGAKWDDFARFASERGLSGAENLAAIPGSVGAAPVQNIGAYGAEQKDIFQSLDFFDFRNEKITAMAAEDCRFSYRQSAFKKELAGKGIVTKVRYRLSKSFSPNVSYPDLARRFYGAPPQTPFDVYRAVSEIRAAKLPDPSQEGNAGSFFKNPVVSAELFEKLRVLIPELRSFPTAEAGKVKAPAAALIERAGFKGAKRGAAGVSERHALVLINRGGASGTEIASLAQGIMRKVKSKFGVSLEPEVLIVK
ncbi:MAG: UDP-N-acetylmuramate dehydrogenase [Chloroflexota bacterium]